MKRDQVLRSHRPPERDYWVDEKLYRYAARPWQVSSQATPDTIPFMVKLGGGLRAGATPPHLLGP